MADRVSITRFNGNLRQTIKLGLSSIEGLKEAEGPYLIKPNLCTAVDPSYVATTSPAFMKTVVDMIFEEDRNATVKIIESDSSGKWAAKAFENLGYMKLIDEYKTQGYDVSLINLSNEPTTSIRLDGAHFKTMDVPTILSQPKFFISLAKTKTHALTQITGALKNQFGCLPEKNKIKHHNRIEKVIVDINKVINPNLIIIDAITGLEGVTEGKTREIGVILCGRYPASTDAVLARIMGFDPLKIGHIALAVEYSLGELNPEVVGETASAVAVKFRKTTSLVSTLGKHVPEGLLPLAIDVYQKLRQPS